MIKEATLSQSRTDASDLWRLAAPAIALNALQTVNSLLDNFFVQRLSPEAVTAIGASTNVIFLFISVSMALGTAATAIVSRAFGADDHPEVKEAASRCLAFSLVVGAVFAVLAVPGAFFTAHFFIRDGNLEAKRLAVTYLAAFAFGLPAFFTVQSLAGALRGVGDTVSPMVISGLQIVLHMVLNYVFIFPSHSFGGLTFPGLGLGLAGAGWAMCVSGWVAAVGYYLWCRTTSLGRLRLAVPSWHWTTRIFKLATPAATTNVLRVVSMMMLMAILVRVPGSDFATGGLRPGFAIESLAFMPPFGLAIAAAALVGQSLGAGDPSRAERLGWMAAHAAGAVAFAAVLFLFPFSTQVAGWVLHDQPAFVPYTASFLRYICLTEVLFAYSMVLITTTQGAGDTVRPLWMTIVVTFVVRVPLAWFLALGLKMGADGVWIAMATSQAILGLGAMALWKQGAWKLAKV